MADHYDVIIAGAGAAGAIIAARLTEDAGRSVLLLDAGPDFPDLESLPEEIRYAYGRDRNIWDRAFGSGTKFGWGYRARGTDSAPDIFIPRGKIVGGSSAVNAQIFLRGVPEDYDSWAAAGNDEWSYQRLLPFFCMNETDLDYGDKPYHGDAGPIRARRFKDAELNPEHRAFYAAIRRRVRGLSRPQRSRLHRRRPSPPQQRRGHPLEHGHWLPEPGSLPPQSHHSGRYPRVSSVVRSHKGNGPAGRARRHAK